MFSHMYFVREDRSPQYYPHGVHYIKNSNGDRYTSGENSINNVSHSWQWSVLWVSGMKSFRQTFGNQDCKSGYSALNVSSRVWCFRTRFHKLGSQWPYFNSNLTRVRIVGLSNSSDFSRTESRYRSSVSIYNLKTCVRDHFSLHVRASKQRIFFILMFTANWLSFSNSIHFEKNSVKNFFKLTYVGTPVSNLAPVSMYFSS